MIDLHSHVLPGLDDGCPDPAASLALLALYAAQGVTDVVCTPHLPPPDAPDARPEDYAPFLARRDAALAALRAAAAEPYPGIRLHSGAEILLSSGLQGLLDACLRSCGLAGSTHLLVETPMNAPGALRAADRMLFRIQLAGAMPVLAHPDRMNLSPNELDLLASWAVQDRVRLLLNAVALLPPEALPPERRDAHRRRKAAADRLLDAGAVFAVASDTHGATSRPPVLDRARREVDLRYGARAAALLFEENPRSVLAEGDAG